MAPTIVSAPVLLGTGFNSSGVGAGTFLSFNFHTSTQSCKGTIAAGIQSSIGTVATGSSSVPLQSAGAGGAGLTVINGVVQVGGGAIAAAGSGLAVLKSKLI
jgi:hypothetical protein